MDTLRRKMDSAESSLQGKTRENEQLKAELDHAKKQNAELVLRFQQTIIVLLRTINNYLKLIFFYNIGLHLATLFCARIFSLYLCGFSPLYILSTPYNFATFFQPLRIFNSLTALLPSTDLSLPDGSFTSPNGSLTVDGPFTSYVSFTTYDCSPPRTVLSPPALPPYGSFIQRDGKLKNIASNNK